MNSSVDVQEECVPFLTMISDDDVNDDDDVDVDPNFSDLPPSLIFIISNEFCERFSYFGMKALIPLYLVNWLSFTQTEAMTIFHFFIMAAYFFSLFGGVLSDNVLGRYRTILYLSILYCFGSVMVVVSSIPFSIGDSDVVSKESHFYLLFSGLMLIAMGTGGIKPCVCSFGADQIISHQDIDESNQNVDQVISDKKAKLISLYFNIFYLSINIGCISILITPIVRSHYSCFNHHSCYPLAFAIPTALLIASTIIFRVGKSSYRAIGKPNTSGSNDPGVVVSFVKLIYYSSKMYIKRRIIHYLNESNNSLVLEGESDEVITEDFFACCREKWSNEFIEESRKVLKIIKIFVPITIYWSLYDQQASLWVFQAALLDGKLKIPIFGNFVLMPEQMGLINAFLVLILIPFLQNLYILISTLNH